MKNIKLDFGKWASVLLVIALGSAFAYLGVRYLLPVAIPFLLAWGVAIVLRPVNHYLHKKLGLPVRLIAFFTVLLALLLVSLLAWGVIGRLVREVRSAVEYLTAEPSPLEGLFAWLSPEVGEEAVLSRVEQYGRALLGHLAEALLAALPPLVGSAVLSLPGFLLSLLVTVVAAFYFSIDLERVHAAIRSLLPEGWSASLGRMRAGAYRLGLGDLRSYLILVLVIFFVMLVGLSVLGVEYALLLALLLAAVDILPVIGVGTVLIPWGIVSLASGRGAFGLGLILLFAVAEIVRQVLEPRLVGAALGVHPLLSLLSLYLGARLFGLLGLILGPLLAVLLRLLFSWRSGEKTKNPSYDGVSVGQARSTLPERRQREQT